MKNAASYNAALTVYRGHRKITMPLFCQTLNNVVFGYNMI